MLKKVIYKQKHTSEISLLSVKAKQGTVLLILCSHLQSNRVRAKGLKFFLIKSFNHAPFF